MYSGRFGIMFFCALVPGSAKWNAGESMAAPSHGWHFGGANWLTSHAQCSEFYSIWGSLSFRDNLTNRIWRLPAFCETAHAAGCTENVKNSRMTSCTNKPAWKCILKRRVDLLMTMNRVFVCPVIPLSEKSAFASRTTQKSHDCTMSTELERQTQQSSLKSHLVIGFLSERGAWGLKLDAHANRVPNDASL